jgi:hypothetical protein
MPARDYSVPIKCSYIRPSFTRASLERPSGEANRMPVRRTARPQFRTNLYLHLDINPQHRLVHCSTVYEVEDRTKPSISSF